MFERRAREIKKEREWATPQPPTPTPHRHRRSRLRELDTTNDSLISSNGRMICALVPLDIRSREQGFRTAAWIASMAETLPSELSAEEQADRAHAGLSASPTFLEILKAVRST